MSAIDFSNQMNDHTAALRGFALSLTKDINEAKDLFQETAYRAFKNRDKYKPNTNLKAWLMTIMRNIFINNYRKKTRENTIIDQTDNNYYINTGGPTVKNKSGSNIMMEELIQMIDELEDFYRIPFMMHYRGFKYQEIADHMDLPLGTIKSRIYYARKGLKKMIGERYENVNMLLQ